MANNGLITLNTDLKSLRYGTIPLGSDKPYVTKDIGQAPGSQIGAEISHRIDDVSRIAQMLVGKPGIKYLLHEAELQQIGVGQRIKKAQKEGKSLVGAVLGQIGNTLVTTVKIVGSTIAQVPVNGTGTHFLKAFRTDTYLQPSGGSTASAFAQFFGAGGIEGAQYALRGEEVPGERKTELTDKYSKYDYDEYLNTPIPKNSSEHKALIESGKPITIPGPQYETTAQPYELGRSNQIKEADQGELLTDNSRNVGKTYSPEDTYTGKIAKDVITNALEGAPIPVTPTAPGSVSPKETTLIKGTIGIANEIDDKTPQYQNPFIYNYKEPGPPPVVTDSQKYYTSQSINHQEVFGEPMKDTTVPKGALGESQIIKKDDLVSIHPSISTNKYLGNSEKGPVPAPALFADGKLDTYIVDASKKNENTWGEALQDTTAPEGTIGRVRDRDPEVDSVPKFLPHIVDEKFDTVGPPPNYDPADTYLAYKRNIPTFNKNVLKESRVRLGDQGGRNDINKLTNQYWTTSPTGLEIDKVNALDISTTLLEGVTTARDLAKFYFEIITPDGSKFLYFRAFIDSIDDGYNADWQARKYNGRAENFYTYGGFDRDISISFNVAAASRSEMKPLFKKMVYLASATAPTYGTSGLMRGTLARITVGSYLAQIPGVLTSVKFTLDNNTPWEIAMGNPEGGSTTDDDVQELPMLLKCSISFKPIHDFAPQTGLHHYFTSPNPLNGSKPFFTNGQAV